MGNFMSNVTKKAAKPLKNYNLETRVFKVINKEKATPAPRHRNTKQPFLNMSEDKEVSLKKNLFESDPNLLKRLQQVYVTSSDPPPPETMKSTRPLPVSREYVEQPLYGYHEPKRVPIGMLTLKTALNLISMNQEDSEKWNSQALAKEYNLEVAQTEQLLKYFKTFVLVIPTLAKDMEKSKMQAPSNFLGAHSVLHVPKLENKKNMDESHTVAGS